MTLCMNRFCFLGLVSSLSLSLLLVNFGTISRSAQAQTSQPANCQAFRQQNLESQASLLEGEAQQAVSRGDVPLAIRLYRQVFNLTTQIPDELTKSNFLERLIEGYNFQESQLGRLVAAANASDNPQLLDLLSQLQSFTQQYRSGSSLKKAKGFIAIATAYRLIGQSETGRSLIAQALQTSRLLKNDEFKPPILSAIAEESLALNQAKQAEQILKEAWQITKTTKFSEPYRQDESFKTIAVIYAQINPSIAVGIPPTISNAYYKAEAQSAIVRGYLQVKRLNEARTYAKAIVDVEAKSRSLVAIAVQLTQSGQVQQGNQLFVQALQVAQPAQDRADSIKGRLIETYAKAGQRDVAFKAAQTLTQDEPKAIALGIIANEYGKVGQSQQADQVVVQLLPLLKSSRATEPTGWLSSVLDNAVKDKQFKIALDIFRSVKSSDFLNQDYWFTKITNEIVQSEQLTSAIQIANAFKPEQTDYRNRFLRKIAIKLAQINKTDQAIAIAKQTQNSDYLPYQVVTLAEVASRSGAQGDPIFAQAIASFNSLTAIQARVQSAAALGREFIRSNRREAGQKWIQQAVAIAKQDQDYEVILEVAFTQAIEAEQYEIALQLAQAMPATERREFKFREIQTHLIETEAFDRALNVARAFTQPEAKTQGLIMLATAMVNSNRISQTLPVLEQAFQSALKISDPESKTIQVREDLQVDDDSDRASSLEAIAHLYAKTKRVDRALQVAQKIQDPKLRNPLLQKLQCYR